MNHNKKEIIYTLVFGNQTKFGNPGANVKINSEFVINYNYNEISYFVVDDKGLHTDASSNNFNARILSELNINFHFIKAVSYFCA